jgi:amino acid permease
VKKLNRSILIAIIAIIIAIIVVSIVTISIQPTENEDEILAKREALKAYMKAMINDTYNNSNGFH